MSTRKNYKELETMARKYREYLLEGGTKVDPFARENAFFAAGLEQFFRWVNAQEKSNGTV